MTTNAGESRPRPKLPVTQLTILAIARVSEPMAYTSVFPYLPDMIRSFGVKQKKVARWAGLTSGVFSIAQSITAVGWGKASDYYGRKPTIILGLISTMLCFVVWGMSTSLPMAIIVRAIQGGGNGNVGIIRTMVAEMVPEKELQPRAFSVMPLVWSLGSVIGPSFGGFFAEPAKQYPDIFGNIEFFHRFPFALPNLLLTVFFLASATVATLFLQETLPSKKNEPDWGLAAGRRLKRSIKGGKPMPSTRRRSFVDGEATAPLIPSKVDNKPKAHEAHSHTMGDVFTAQTSICLLAYTFLAFHSVTFDQVLPVFLNYDVVKQTPENFKPPFYFTGGFGLSSSQIGTLFTMYGVVCGVIQFLCYPPVVNRFGVLQCYKVCSLVLPIIYLLTPYTVLMPSSTTRFAALTTLMFVKGAAIIFAFPSVTILLTNSCTSVKILGTLNGFATATSGIGRALGPTSTGSIFTWGVEHGYGVAAWYFLAIVAIIGTIPVFYIVEGAGPTASANTSDDEDSDATEPLFPSDSAVTDDSGNDSDDERSRPPSRARSSIKSYGTIKRSIRS